MFGTSIFGKTGHAYYHTCTAPLVKKQGATTKTMFDILASHFGHTALDRDKSLVGAKPVSSHRSLLRRGDGLLKRYTVKMGTRCQHKSDGCTVALASSSRQTPMEDKYRDRGGTYDKGVGKAWIERGRRLNTLHLLGGQRNV